MTGAINRGHPSLRPGGPRAGCSEAAALRSDDDLLFTFELQRRLAAAGSTMRSIAAHPGIAATSLAAHAGGITALISKLTLLQNDAEHGALPTLYAATQDVPGGSYVGPDGIASIKGYPKIGKPSRAARNSDTARQLWDISSRLTGAGSALLNAA